MNIKIKYIGIAIILMVAIIAPSVLADDPQNAHYIGGQWWNDRGEIMNSDLWTDYTWIDGITIYVNEPQLSFRELSFDNGEVVQLTQGATTITLTADTTITLTVVG